MSPIATSCGCMHAKIFAASIKNSTHTCVLRYYIAGNFQGIQFCGNSIVITVTIYYSHRQECGLQLYLYSYSVIGTPVIA